MTAPVRIITPTQSTRPVLVVTVAGWETGGIIPDAGLFVAAVRRPWTGRHRFTGHATAAEALAVVLASRLSRSRGAGPLSNISWTEAAALLAREPAEVTR